MANLNCSACEDIRENAPSLVVNGFDETMCASLQNNTGLNPSSGNDDCTDLNNLNDCLIGNEVEDVDLYEVCDWKSFMKMFIPNIWTVFKGIICSICGLWTKVTCTYNALVKLVDQLGATTGGLTFIRYYRDNSGGGGTQYAWSYPASDATGEAKNQYLEVYMDADLDDPGSTEADRDYVVIISYCCDYHKFSKVDATQTWYSSADTRDISLIRQRQGQHPTVHKADPSGEFFRDFSWAITTAVMVEKGAHLKFQSHIDSNEAASDGWYRVHQVTMTWIPANIDQTIDPSEILDC